MRRSFSGVAALMMVLAVAQLARGADDQSWIGRRVIIKRAEVRPQIGKQPTGDPLRTVFTVEQAQGEWLWVGEGWLRQGDVVRLDRAAAWFDNELKKLPTAFAYLGRGIARCEQGDLDGALADCTAAMKIAPRSQRAYADRAFVFAKKREMTLALNDVQQAMTMGPSSAVLLGIRGAIRADLRDYRGAMDDLNRALQMNPRDAEGYSNRGVAYQRIGNRAAALADLSQAIALDPRNPLAYANRGWIHALEHRYDQALEDFDEAVRLDPKFVHVRVNRGDSWALQGQFDKAIAEYNEAIRLDPKCDAAWRFRSAAHRRSGNLALAASDIEEAIRIAPKEAGNYCERARLDDVRGQYAAMLKDATKAIELDPKNEDAFQCRASARSFLNDITGSIADLTRAIELMPNNGRRYFQRARIFFAAADYREALADCDAAVRLLPRETQPLLYRAMAHAALGNFARAKQDIAEAVRLAPNPSFNAYGILAQVNALEAGDPQAVVALERALPGAKPREQAAIYSQLAWILATYPDEKIRDGQKAFAAAKKACELSDGRSLWAVAGLAAAYAECGDFAAAADFQQKALALATSTDPSVAMPNEAIADGVLTEMRRRLALYRSGQPARANQRFGSKIGSRVIARSRDMRLQIGGRPIGEPLGETVLAVERVQRDWLWVGRGWIRTEDVVTVEAAVSDYVQRIARVTLASDLKRALDDCDAALRLSPDYGYLYALRASIRQLQGDKAGAQSDLQKSRELDPNGAGAFLMILAQAAEQKGDYAEAIKMYSQILENEGASRMERALSYAALAEIWSERAGADLRDGDRALEAGKKACELTYWKLPQALSALGAAHAECGDFAEAIRWQEAARELPPEALATAFGDEKYEPPLVSSTDMFEVRLDCYRQRKRLYEVRTGGVVAGVSSEAFEHLKRASDQESKGDLAGALAEYDAAIRLAPKVAGFYMIRASCHEARGDFPAALADFRKAIEFERENPAVVWKLLGLFFERHGRDAEAVDAYTHTIDEKRSPADQADAHLALAKIWAESRDDRIRDGRRAVEAAQKGCELGEWKSREALTVLASAYAECGAFQQAAQWQAKAIELPPPEHEAEYAGGSSAEFEQSRLQELNDRLASYRAGKRFESRRPTIRVGAARVERR